MRSRVGPLGSGPEPQDFAADSLVSQLDRAAFVDGPVNSAVQTGPIFKQTIRGITMVA